MATCATTATIGSPSSLPPSSATSVLKRGGKHPIFSTYAGGASLNKEYKLSQMNCY